MVKIAGRCCGSGLMFGTPPIKRGETHSRTQELNARALRAAA